MISKETIQKAIEKKPDEYEDFKDHPNYDHDMVSKEAIQKEIEKHPNLYHAFKDHPNYDHDMVSKEAIQKELRYDPSRYKTFEDHPNYDHDMVSKEEIEKLTRENPYLAHKLFKDHPNYPKELERSIRNEFKEPLMKMSKTEEELLKARKILVEMLNKDDQPKPPGLMGKIKNVFGGNKQPAQPDMSEEEQHKEGLKQDYEIARPSSLCPLHRMSEDEFDNHKTKMFNSEHTRNDPRVRSALDWESKRRATDIYADPATEAIPNKLKTPQSSEISSDRPALEDVIGKRPPEDHFTAHLRHEDHIADHYEQASAKYDRRWDNEDSRNGINDAGVDGLQSLSAGKLMELHSKLHNESNGKPTIDKFGPLLREIHRRDSQEKWSPFHSNTKVTDNDIAKEHDAIESFKHGYQQAKDSGISISEDQIKELNNMIEHHKNRVRFLSNKKNREWLENT
jgi:hypothetical protein